MPLMSIVGFVLNNLGWFLLAAIAIAAIGAVSLASARARELGISNWIFVTAAIVGIGSLLAYACAIAAISLGASPS